jgi:hypothetical protein
MVQEYFIVINSGVLVIIIVHVFALTAIKELFSQINFTKNKDYNQIIHYKNIFTIHIFYKSRTQKKNYQRESNG